jgi:hypothetical protein
METETITENVKPEVPEGYFKAFDCSICEEDVFLPLCPNVKTDRYERLIWSIYMLKMEEKPQLCYACRKIYESEIEKKTTFRFSNKSVISEDDLMDAPKVRVVTKEDENRAVEYGLVEIDSLIL